MTARPDFFSVLQELAALRLELAAVVKRIEPLETTWRDRDSPPYQDLLDSPTEGDLQSPPAATLRRPPGWPPLPLLIPPPPTPPPRYRIYLSGATRATQGETFTVVLEKTGQVICTLAPGLGVGERQWLLDQLNRLD